MKHKMWLIASLCLLVPSMVVAQAAAGNKPQGNKAAPDKALMQKILEAWATLKTENVARFYDKSPGNVYYDVAPVKYNGWAEYEKGVATMSPTLESMTFKINDDAVVHRAGNWAWGTATVHTVMVQKNGHRLDMVNRWSVIWAKKGPEWMIVHDHFSAPLPMPE